MDKEKLCRVSELLCRRIERYADQNDVDTEDAEYIRNLSSGYKNILKICRMKEEEEGRSYAGGNSYRSWADGVEPGRADSYRGGSMRDGSYGDGSYHGRAWTIRELEDAKSFANGPGEQEAIRKAMDILRRMQR